ncbi:HDOD domain-containing protein [Lysobacter sp. D1-1-M9]|uniref:HDOD domain-containing protein n=1 Tax=Novilysobacter longmucuonensis TaxID=3098603 RepID=UPI002FCB1669
MFIVIVGEEGGRANEFEQALADFGLGWDVRWLPDAAAALALPNDRPVDVVVCDLRVGNQQGPALLAQMRAHHSDAVRILLVDEGQGADLSQALEVAHRLLRKPLDAGELIEAVESVIELRELLDNEQLKQAIGRIGSLPPPPRLYVELTRLMQDPESSSAQIGEVLSQDPVIAAKVLRLCNSAYFSAGRVVTDVRAAVTRLGLQTIQRLVLATEAFSGSGVVNGIDREAMQDRALRTSRLAAQLLGGPSAELAATAGLLAEVGMLLPGVRIPGREPEHADTGDGPHYAEAGAYLLGLWGLPMPIVEAVASHHEPSRMRMSGFWVGGAVHVASALVCDTPVDENYLRAVGLIDRLPRWRSMAEELAEAA